MSEKIIMWDSNEAAQFVTVKGWLSSKGHFYNNEDIARYDGCTHKVCDCGNIMHKNMTTCNDCQSIKDTTTYNSLPRKLWDGEACVYSLNHDTWFNFEEDIFLFLEEMELEDFLNLSSLSELQLIFGVPNSSNLSSVAGLLDLFIASSIKDFTIITPCIRMIFNCIYCCLPYL